MRKDIRLKKWKGLMFALLWTMSLGLFAQNITVRGVITDNAGSEVIGATVIVAGDASKGTITDMDGKYTLAGVPSGASLQISYVGLKTQIVPVNGRTTINVVLASDTELLDEVVVVGFATQKKVNVTGSVSVVDSKELTSRPVRNVSQALQGLVPGMNFSYGGNGGGLNSNMKIDIRGAGTLDPNKSNSSPLVLIDGMEGDMNTLNPQDIESISVLKDAAASSIYGSRAPFGVVLITTKKGKEGKASINYNNNFRWVQAINMPDVAEAYDYAVYFNKMNSNSGAGPQFDKSRLQDILDYAAGKRIETTRPASDSDRWDWIGNTNTKWYDVAFGKTSFAQEHAVSISGGSDKYQYFFSGNLMSQDGLLAIRPDNLKRYAVTGKINAQILPWLSFGYNTKWIRNDYTRPTAMDDNVLYHNLAKRWPMEPTTDPNGHYMSGIINPILYGGDNRDQTDWVYQQAQFIAEPIKGWRTFGEFNYKTIDLFTHNERLKTPMWDSKNTLYYEAGSTNGVTDRATRTNYLNINLYSEYSKSLDGGHFFKVMAGFQTEENKWRKLQASKMDLISEKVPNVGVATGKETIGASDEGFLNEWATAGFFGRINYNYKERYLAEVNMRYDGTSRFMPDQRWNLFPSVSLGWNVAREAFMEPFNDMVNNLKVRGSWGRLGNQNTASIYPFYQVMDFKSQASTWLINGNKPNKVGMPNLISTLLTWETMESWNLGLDLAVLRNRLTLSLDVFNRKTLNMVGPAPELPVTLGIGVPNVNNADMESTGFEMDLGWKDKIGDFSYNVHFLLSDDRQKVTRYPNTTGKFGDWYAGKYMGEIWGFETVGIAKTDDEMKSHLASLPKGGQNALGSNWAAGDIMYRDINNDGQVSGGASTLNDPGDRRIIGNSSPRYKFGFDVIASYKGFDFRMFIQGVGKRDFWFNDNMFWGAAGGVWQSGVFKNHLDYFRPEGDELGANLNAYYPRPLTDGRNQQVQTGYLQSGAYARLKNIQLGYTIPASLTQKAGISNLRIFFSAENVFTFTKLPRGFDPETIGVGYGTWAGGYTSGKAYPLARTFSTGLSINF